MSNLIIFGERLSIHDKFEVVKRYYEKHYKVRFKKKISDDQVEDLFQKMEALNKDVGAHFQKKPGLREKFIQKMGLEEVKPEA